MKNELFWSAMLFALVLCTSPASGGERMPWPVVAHWTMDEVNDATIADSGRHGIDGRVNGEGKLQTTEGVNGRAILLPADGTHWIDLPAVNHIDQLRVPFTIAAWIRPNAESGDGEIFGCKWDSVHSGYRLRCNGKLYFGLGNGDESVWLVSEQVVPRGNWTHVAASYDGQTMRVFINGAAAGERAFRDAEIRMQEAVHPAVIGNYVGGKDIYAFDGSLDELIIMRQSLTAADVGRLAQLTATGE